MPGSLCHKCTGFVSIIAVYAPTNKPGNVEEVDPSFNLCSKLSITRRKRWGDRTDPCLTLHSMTNSCERHPLSLRRL